MEEVVMIRTGDRVRLNDGSGAMVMRGEKVVDEAVCCGQRINTVYTVLATNVPNLPTAAFELTYRKPNDTILQTDKRLIVFSLAKYCVPLAERSHKQLELKGLVKQCVQDEMDAREFPKGPIRFCHPKLPYPSDPPRHGFKWTEHEDSSLAKVFTAFCERQGRLFQRTPEAIRERVRNLFKRCKV